MNITDPDSRNLKCRRGHKQGYNAQAVVTEDQIVIAAELNTDSPDFGHQRSARSRSVHRRRAGSCSGRSSTAMSSGGTRRPPFRARGRPRRWVLARPQLKARCRLGRGGATSRRGPRQLHLPGGAEDRTSPWPSVSFTEVRAVGLPEVAECLQASEFQRGPQALGSSPPARRRRRTHWRSATSPRRCVFLKGIVTSPATARALCHASDHAVGAALTIASVGTATSPCERPATTQTETGALATRLRRSGSTRAAPIVATRAGSPMYHRSRWSQGDRAA